MSESQSIIVTPSQKFKNEVRDMLFVSQSIIAWNHYNNR